MNQISSQPQLTRRQFLGKSATAVIVAGTMAQGKVFGANSRIGVCTIGFHGQGHSHIQDILGLPGEAEYVALCDVDSTVLDEWTTKVQEKQGKAPKKYKDIREALQDKSIDAITIATPNHWHSLAAVWGCQAGKDVYVEKPMSHNVYEGRQVVAAAQKYGRIVQHGTQNRSESTLIRDMKLMHDGFIGKIIESRGYVYKNGNRGSIGRGKPGPVPEYLDWTLWQGPSQEHPFMINTERKKPGLYVHYDWHYFWEYGNGEIGNQGVHQMDEAVWGHNRGLPVRVYSSGGRFGLDDDGQTPNTQATVFTYADGSILTFQVRNLGSFNEGGAGNCANSFFGTKGFYVRNKGFFEYQEDKSTGDHNPIPVPADAPKPSKASKWQRFFKAVRSRNQADAPMSPLEAHHSCVHCQLGNIAYRLGRSLEFDPQTERFKDDEANKFIKRDYRKGFEVPNLA
jgi:predicted dehydrogenase